MEIKVLEQKKNRIVFEIEGEDNSFCNLLKQELLNDNTVKIATYNIEHPLTSNPKMLVEADDAVKALKDAAKRLGKLAEKFKDDFSKEVK